MIIELSTKHAFDTTAIHADSIAKLLRKGAMHLRNEVASHVQSKIEQDARSGIVRKAKDVPGDSTEVKKAKLEAFRTAHPDVVDALFDAKEAAMVADLISGAFAAEKEPGESKRLTDLERETRTLAKVELEATLGQRPKLTDELVINGKPMTYEALIESYVSGKHKARLEKDAQKVIDARKARADRQTKVATTKDDSGKLAVALDL